MICPTCNGKKVAVISCCTGDVVVDDYEMCPVCHEHLGEEDCPDCDGTGEVEDDTPVRDKVDMQLKAEFYNDLMKGL